jgi:hypothetical protein
MIVMDRENAMARGWSHVHSDALKLEDQEVELQAFRRKVGAPPSAFQRGSWLHLDIMRGPRRKALGDPNVRVYATTRDLVLHLRASVPRNTPNNARAVCATCGAPATCFGSYEGHPAAYGCDTCCGHGCEDGACRLLTRADEHESDPPPPCPACYYDLLPDGLGGLMCLLCGYVPPPADPGSPVQTGGEG